MFDPHIGLRVFYWLFDYTEGHGVQRKVPIGLAAFDVCVIAKGGRERIVNGMFGSEDIKKYESEEKF